MAILNIPKEHHKTIIEISNLTDEQKETLLDAMRDSRLSLDVTNLVEQIERKSSLPPRLASRIVSIVHTLYAVVDHLERTPSSIVDDVIETIQANLSTDWKELSTEQVVSIENFFRQALTLNDSIGLAAKALRVASQHERLFLAAEIYTDIRTVFSVDNPELTPAAAVLTHMLKLDYREDGRERSIYLALDKNDLIDLQEVAERALQKQSKLANALESIELRIAEPE